MLTIALVYKSGGDFNGKDVSRLVGGLRWGRHQLKCDHKIVCLTDAPEEVQHVVDAAITLKQDFPCWWSKMEIFRLTPPVLYLDLDTIVVGDVSQVCEATIGLKADEFLMVRGFYRNDPCSCMMGWIDNLSWLADLFTGEARTAEWVKQTHGIGAFIDGQHFLGDQDYIASRIQDRLKIVWAQDRVSGIYSYKVHIRERTAMPEDASLIMFHGRPRPTEIGDELDRIMGV